MDTRNNPQRQLKTRSRSQYLIAYNATSSLLWFAVLGCVVLLVPLVGFEEVYGGVGTWTKWTQTLMAVEVVHAATGAWVYSAYDEGLMARARTSWKAWKRLAGREHTFLLVMCPDSVLTGVSAGLVRSPVPTTALQVASRLILVWPILSLHPPTQSSAFYTSMLLAWSVTEVIRYAYFAISLQTGRVPEWLTWLRYNTFYVLYPLGITSEWMLVYTASQEYVGVEYGDEGWWTRIVLWGALLAYLPGSYVLYTHMIRQRRKVLRGKGKERP